MESQGNEEPSGKVIFLSVLNDAHVLAILGRSDWSVVAWPVNSLMEIAEVAHLTPPGEGTPSDRHHSISRRLTRLEAK